MKNEKILGFGILGIIAYLYFRSKRSDSIPQIDPIKEVELRNLQLKETELQNILEDNPQKLSSEIAKAQYDYDYYSDQLLYVRGTNSSDVFVRNNASMQKNYLQSYINDAYNRLQTLRPMFDNAVKISQSEIDKQNFYGSDTLQQIRERLNSSGVNY